MKKLFSAISLARPDIITMKAYSSARREAQMGELWLNANENSYNFSEIPKANRYPDPQPPSLINLYADLFNCDPKNILATRGSDEGIDILVRSFCEPKQDAVVLMPPTYGMYEIAAKQQQAAIIDIPLNSLFEIDVQTLKNSWRPHHKIVFFCTPNNPTGNLFDKKILLSLCEFYREKSILVFDEAYIEFAGIEHSMTSYLADMPHLVILRTLSKAYGLAGLRSGALLAHPEIIALLQKVIAPYPIPTIVTQALEAKLNSTYRQQVLHYIEEVKVQRTMLQEFLANLPYVGTVWPSAANFILFRANNASLVMQHCIANGIVLRERSTLLHLQNCIRLTVGNLLENKRLQQVLMKFTE